MAARSGRPSARARSDGRLPFLGDGGAAAAAKTLLISPRQGKWRQWQWSVTARKKMTESATPTVGSALDQSSPNFAKIMQISWGPMSNV
jgi:hypothetical protein